jgi:hypothetical protein
MRRSITSGTSQGSREDTARSCWSRSCPLETIASKSTSEVAIGAKLLLRGDEKRWLTTVR